MIRSPLSSVYSAIRTIGRTPSGKVGLGLTALFLLVALLAPVIVPYSPYASSGRPLSVPSWKHWLGTDDLGHDLLSQLIYSVRGSIEIGLFAGAIALAVGAGIGLVSGYYGGTLDEILMRATDVILVIPTLVLLLTVAAYVAPSTTTVILLIGMLSWPFTARIVRSQTLSLRNRPYIDSCRMSGMRSMEIILRVIIPLELPLLFLYGVLASISAIVVETGFDLIGLGSFQTLTLGNMLYFAFSDNAMLAGEWWWFLPPGLIIGLFATGLLFIGFNVERLRNR